MSYNYTTDVRKPRNVNQMHAESLSLNDRIALWVSQRVGTMWFCYGLALLMMAWAGVQWAMGDAAPDRYPFPFLFFVLGGIMQSLLMPLIMVAQNQQSRHTELRADEEYKFVVKSYDDSEEIKKDTTSIRQDIERIIGLLDHLLLIEQQRYDAEQARATTKPRSRKNAASDVTQ